MDQVRDASTELFALPPPRRDVPVWRRFLLAATGSLLLHAGMIALAVLLLTRIPTHVSERAISVELAPQTQRAEKRPEANLLSAAAPAHVAQPVPAAPQHAAPKKSSEVAATAAAPAPEQAAPAVAAVWNQALAATSASQAAPSSPSDTAQSRVPAIEAHVLDWLARYRNYPRAARRAGIEGVVMVSTVMGRDGTLVESHIATSSGHPVLDRAALELLARASPVPPLPDLPRDVELHLPIVYQLNR